LTINDKCASIGRRARVRKTPTNRWVELFNRSAVVINFEMLTPDVVRGDDIEPRWGYALNIEQGLTSFDI